MGGQTKLLDINMIDETYALLGLWVFMQACSFRWQFRDSPNTTIRKYHPYGIGVFSGAAVYFLSERPIVMTMLLATNCLCTIGIKGVARSDWFRQQYDMVSYKEQIEMSLAVKKAHFEMLYQYRGVPKDLLPADVRKHMFPPTLKERVGEGVKAASHITTKFSTKGATDGQQGNVARERLSRYIVNKSERYDIDTELSEHQKEMLEKKYTNIPFYRLDYKARNRWFRHPSKTYKLFGLIELKSEQELQREYKEDAIISNREDRRNEQDRKKELELTEELQDAKYEESTFAYEEETEKATRLTLENLPQMKPKIRGNQVDWMRREHQMTHATSPFGNIGKRDPSDYLKSPNDREFV